MLFNTCAFRIYMVAEENSSYGSTCHEDVFNKSPVKGLNRATPNGCQLQDKCLEYAYSITNNCIVPIRTYI